MASHLDQGPRIGRVGRLQRLLHDRLLHLFGVHNCGCGGVGVGWVGLVCLVRLADLFGSSMGKVELWRMPFGDEAGVQSRKRGESGTGPT